ncbi:MAG: ECF transporter S component [Candidatus Bathyarchaeota archaeon]|nr:ECF transporter S component [Candidatus Bathyarchaeota archaeon]
MNQPNQPLHNSNLKIATVDLVLMALFAALGLATKNVLHPLLGPVIGAFYVPTGAVTGGLYMMWPVMAFGFIRKTGAATMVSLIQALISLVLPYGNFGLLSFVIYLGPGLAIDAFFVLSRHKACCLGCCMGASAIANVVGTVLVGALVLFLPLVVLSFLAVIAAISGCIGGFIANMLLVRIGKLGIGGKNLEQKQ